MATEDIGQAALAHTIDERVAHWQKGQESLSDEEKALTLAQLVVLLGQADPGTCLTTAARKAAWHQRRARTTPQCGGLQSACSVAWFGAECRSVARLAGGACAYPRAPACARRS